MSGIEADVWERLGTTISIGDSLTARLALPSVTKRLLAALDSESRRHLLIQLLPDEIDLCDDQSRGVSVTTRELVIHDHGGGRYLDICCNDASGHNAFDLIGGEIANGLVGSSPAPARLVELVLAKWRRFWGELPQQMLSREEQLGLFAELWFLSTWLATYIGIGAAVMRWRGPFGARHDFEWPSTSIEVKATTSVRGRIHQINGLDQLVPPENGVLMLFSLRLREEGGASNTLPGLIAICRSQLKSEPDALDVFETTLANANFAPAYEREYAKLKLRIVEEGLFRVEQDFPRITANSFESGAPAGVERVEYEINLGGCNHLLIATNAAMMPSL